MPISTISLICALKGNKVIPLTTNSSYYPEDAFENFLHQEEYEIERRVFKITLVEDK